MTLILDAGALIALERNDRAMWMRFKAAAQSGMIPRTHGGVVGQAWRKGGPRQALLAQALAGMEVRPVDGALGRAAGELLGRTRGNDVIDAALVLIAADGDRVLTSDLDDIEPLARASGRNIELVAV